MTCAGNFLTGSIPTSITTLPYLAVLILTQNELTGTIPAAIFSSTVIQIIRLVRMSAPSLQSRMLCEHHLARNC